MVLLTAYRKHTKQTVLTFIVFTKTNQVMSRTIVVATKKMVMVLDFLELAQIVVHFPAF
jgi:hypothetical protein